MQLIETQGDWIQTFKHHKFFPMAPKPEDVDIEDIAHALGNICRWTGHTESFYSVAQHCILASEIVEPEWALWALLHDASEAYISDVSRPVKHDPRMNPYRDIESKVMTAIMEKFGLPTPDTFSPMDMPLAVKEVDNRLLQTEANQLCYPLIDDWKIADPYDMKIYPWHPRVSRIKYLKRFNQLRKALKA